MEILLVVGIIAILAGIVILAINPTKQLGDARNAQRRSDVLTILNALYQYSLDNNGVMPTDVAGLTASPTCDAGGQAPTNEICQEISGDETCTAPIKLYDTLVTASSTYLTAIPKDPSVEVGADGTGYGVARLDSGRITVCAPKAESGVTISVTR